MLMLRSRVGTPVQGEDFFDRKEEQARAWRHLESDNLLLLAPRRVGKTSLMLKLQDTAEQHGFQPVYLSVSDVDTEGAFVERLYQAIQKVEAASPLFQKLEQSWIARFLRKLRLRSASVSVVELEFSAEGRDDWQQMGETLTLALNRLNQRWLILVDELPVFVLSLLKEEPARARRFLNWFRQLRISPDSGAHIRWLLAGSIGLDTVAALHNLGDTINDLRIFDLGAFAPEDADRFLEALGTSYGVSLFPPVRARILERIGWPIPYFLQLVFSEIRDGSNGDAPPAPTAVDAAFDRLLHPTRRGYFDYWRQRLHNELDRPTARQAILLLDHIAANPNGTTRTSLHQALGQEIAEVDQREEAARFLLRVLEGDGYIVRYEGRYCFRSPLLREFWLRDA